MRKIKFQEWNKRNFVIKKRLPRRRPKHEWELINSIIFIKMRDEYLKRRGIIVRVGKRRYVLSFYQK